MSLAPTQLVGPLLEVVGAGQLVPTVNGEWVPYANLDVAASAPALARVSEAVSRLLPVYSSVHRGAGYLSQLSTGVLEDSRAAVADFIGAAPDMSVVFGRNTTDAVNLLASAIPAGVKVITLSSEHHANQLPWRAKGAVVLGPGNDPATLLSEVDAVLRFHPPGHCFLAFAGASNVTGEILPIAELTRVAKSHGARVFLDAAQLAPHRRLDMAELDIDYLAFSGHKLYAPFGAGALVGRSDWLDQAEPYLRGGGAVEKVTCTDVVWRSGPARHEAGTPNLVGIAAMAAACDALSSTGFPAVVEHETALVERLVEGLKSISSASVYSLWPMGLADPKEQPRIGVVSFALDGYNPHQLAAVLSAEHGIGVRSGKFCAHPLVDRLAANGDGAVRASVGLGTSAQDIDRLLTALEQIVAVGPQWSYQSQEGQWSPVNDPRPAPRWDRIADSSGFTGLGADSPN